MFKFKIMDYEWTIEEDEPDSEKLQDDNHTLVNGNTFVDTYEIYLSKTLCPQKLLVTLRHEITHAIIRTTNIGYTRDSYQKIYCEEDVCDFEGKWGDFIHQVKEDYMKYREENK
jgi:predicted Zn-dependent protease